MCRQDEEAESAGVQGSVNCRLGASPMFSEILTSRKSPSYRSSSVGLHLISFQISLSNIQDPGHPGEPLQLSAEALK